MYEQDFVITVAEKRFIVDALKDTLCEVDTLCEIEETDVSQRVIDKLISSLEILGESYE